MNLGLKINDDNLSIRNFASLVVTDLKRVEACALPPT
jgi:hypothetical protein